MRYSEARKLTCRCSVSAFFFSLQQSIEHLSRSEPAFYASWLASLSDDGKAVLQAHAEQAKRHAAEMVEEKAKEEAEKAVKAAGGK